MYHHALPMPRRRAAPAVFLADVGKNRVVGPSGKPGARMPTHRASCAISSELHTNLLVAHATFRACSRGV
jgi:hypothetical protein